MISIKETQQFGKQYDVHSGMDGERDGVVSRKIAEESRFYSVETNLVNATTINSNDSNYVKISLDYWKVSGFAVHIRSERETAKLLEFTDKIDKI